MTVLGVRPGSSRDVPKHTRYSLSRAQNDQAHARPSQEHTRAKGPAIAAHVHPQPSSLTFGMFVLQTRGLSGRKTAVSFPPHGPRLSPSSSPRVYFGKETPLKSLFSKRESEREAPNL